MGKEIVIPTHIINSGDDTHWYNILNGEGNRVGELSRDGNTITVKNISLNSLKTLIGESSASLKDCLTSDKLNDNSYFITNKTGVHSLGEMAGYNHLAKPSTYFIDPGSPTSLNISASGEDWIITVPVELRRGEKIPVYSGNIASWAGVKIVVKLWENIELDPELYQTITVTDVSVPQMRNSTTVNVEVPVPNEDQEYMVEINAYYTYNTTDLLIEDDPLWIEIAANAYYPYDLYIEDSDALKPLMESSSYSFTVENQAPESGNSQSYIGKFYVLLNFTYEITPVTYTGTSEIIVVAPNDSEIVSIDWDQGPTPAEGALGFRTDKEYRIRIYEGDSSLGTLIIDKIWNEGQ